MSISESAILVHRSITAWSGRKYDKQESQELTTRRGAEADAARVNKLLVPKEVLAPIAQLDGEWQKWHESMTLPYPAKGMAILTGEAYFDYAEGTQQRTDRRAALVANLVSSLPTILAGAAGRLGGLLKNGDLPTPEEVERRYSASVVFLPFPSTSRLDAIIGTDAAAASTAFLDATVADAMKDVWQRVYDAVARMADRLDARTADPGARLYASVIDNVSEIADLLPKLNLTGDGRLEAMRQELVSRLTPHSVDDLREDDELRESTADAARRMMTAMTEGGYL